MHRLTETEFRAWLRQRDLSVSDACRLLYQFTGAIFIPRDLNKSFSRADRLSKTESGLWRAFFKLYDIDLQTRGITHERQTV